MSENSYNLRPRIKVRSRSETRSALSHEPSSVTRSAVARSILTGEKGPVPGQHPVPEVVGSVVAPSPGPEMWSRQVFSLLLYLFYCSVICVDFCDDVSIFYPFVNKIDWLNSSEDEIAYVNFLRQHRTRVRNTKNTKIQNTKSTYRFLVLLLSSSVIYW